MNEPDIVDLRRMPREATTEPTGSSPSPPRRTWLAGLGLLVLGALGGWLVAQPADDVEPVAEVPVPTGSEAPAPAPSPLDRDTDDADATVTESTGPPPPLSGQSPAMPAGEAELELLDGVGALAGPVTVVPGLAARSAIRLSADGTLGFAVDPVEEPFDGDFTGYPLGELDGGILYSPIDYALGAVAYWSPGRGVSLPVPDAPYETSFLAGAGTLGVFLSGADVVVRDLDRAETVLRTEATIEDAGVVHACLSADSTRLALVDAGGVVVVIGLQDGREVTRLRTSTPRFGIAWSGPDQMVHLEEEDGAQRLVATDLGSGTRHEIARLGRGGEWKLTTPGTGC